MGGRRNKSRKVWRAKVARVAKATTLRAVETLRLGSTLTAANLLQPASLASNVAFSKPTDLLVQGPDSDEIVGREIILKGMQKNFVFYNTGTINPDQPRMVRVLCLKIDPYVSSSTLAYNQLFVQGSSPDPGTWILRTEKEPTSIIQKVYYDRMFTLPAVNIAGQYAFRHVKSHVDFHNMKWRRNTAASVIGSDFDIIWALMSWVPGNAAGDANVLYSSDDRLYYKDP